MTTEFNGDTGADTIKDGIVTQSKLATGVAGTGPVFRAWNSSAMSLPNSTFTKVWLQSKDFDTATAFDEKTNYRFQPSVAGHYQINGAVTLVSTALGVVGIVKNGAVAAYGQYSTALTFVVSNIVFMNGSTDYVELWMSQSYGSTVNTIPGSEYTYFSGALVRAA